MRAVVMHAPGDVRVEEIEAPVIVEPTDAIIRVTATCVCGSDLWPYRGIEELNGPTPMGHEYVASSNRSAPTSTTSKLGTSSWARSSRRTTPAKSARPAFSLAVSTRS